MFAWEDFLKKYLGEPRSFEEVKPLLKIPKNYPPLPEERSPSMASKILDYHTRRLHLWQENCKKYSHWYFKNEFAVGYIFGLPSGLSFLFQNIRTNIYVQAFLTWTLDHNRHPNPDEIESLIQAIADPNLWPLCINIDWAHLIIDSVFKPLETT